MDRLILSMWKQHLSRAELLHCKDLPRYHLLRFARTTRKETRGLAGKATWPSHMQNLISLNLKCFYVINSFSSFASKDPIAGKKDFTCIYCYSTHLYFRWNVLVTLGATLEQGKHQTPFLWEHHCFCHFHQPFAQLVSSFFHFSIILRYGFLCSCPACSVDDVDVETSDARRVEVARLVAVGNYQSIKT